MITAEEARLELASLTTEEAFSDRSDELAASWCSRGAPVEAVDIMLIFMEQHPTWDFGMPGALVHFVEQFYGRGYEEKLLQSLDRRPTFHTVWMLNRIINAQTEASHKSALVQKLVEVLNFPGLDESTRQIVERFLALHRDD